MNVTETSNKLYGVHNGIYYGQNERVDEINNRYQSRQFSDQGLEPNYDPRPVPTKYSLFPIVDRRPIHSNQSPIQSYPVHSVQSNFNPSNTRGPSSGFFTNVDTESFLKNQGIALQHGADQGVYVPSSKSDLYNSNTTVVSSPSVQPYPNLFYQPSFSSRPHPNLENNMAIGNNTFYNHTRTQLRNL